MNFHFIFLFIVGVTRYVDLGLLGRVAISELLMIVALPLYLFANFRKPIAPEWRWLLPLFSLAILSVLVSDHVNSVPLDMSLRGYARYGFVFIISIFWVFALRNPVADLRAFLLGSILGSGISLFRVSEYDRLGAQLGTGGYDYWLSKITPFIAAIAFVLAYYLYEKSRSIIAIGFGFMGCVIALFGSRAAALTFVGASIAIFYIISRRRETLPSRVVANRLSLTKLVALVGICACIGYLSYITLAPSGYLGEYQQEKFERHASSELGVTPWGLILAGRVDFLESLLVVRDNPLWGVGSGSIPRDYLMQAYSMIGLRPPQYILNMYAESDTSGHSVIMSSWATGGVLTIFFWLFVFWITLKVVRKYIDEDNSLSPYVIVSGIGLLFTLWFNPLSLASRNMIGLFIALALVLPPASTAQNTRRVPLQVPSNGGGRN